MKLQDILSRIARVELKTKRALAGQMTGDYRTRRIGSGYDFHQLREYQEGDDIRRIDFKSSARQQKLLVREYIEDRNRTVYLVVDVSGSMSYGSSEELKISVMQDCALSIAYAAYQSKDDVGLILFSDVIERIVPPRSSRAHFFYLAQELLSYKPKSGGTNFECVISYLLAKRLKRAAVYLISDFITAGDISNLAIAGSYHEIKAVRCMDQREMDFSSVGLLTLRDLETGTDMLLDTSDRVCSDALRSYHDQMTRQLNRVRIPVCDVWANQDYISLLTRFLARGY